MLLLSAYSEAENSESQRDVFQMAWQRLLERGVPDDRLEKIRDSRNKVVFSLDAAGSRLRWSKPAGALLYSCIKDCSSASGCAALRVRPSVHTTALAAPDPLARG